MGIQFKSVEQAFQYTKTYYSAAPDKDIEELRRKILATTDGAQLRRLGRSVPALDVRQWDADKESIMHDYILESFRQNPDALSELLATGETTLTHTQSKDEWNQLFPKILMQVRQELGMLQESGPQVSLSTHFLRKDEPQRTPDIAFFFTDNAEAYMYSHGLKGWDEMGPNPLAPKINVSDRDGHNQAGIRTGSDGKVTPNAYGLIVKKYQQDAYGRFVAQEGCFKETEEDFDIFRRLNEYSFESIREKEIVFPTQMALSKSALPLSFAKWMQAQLAGRFGIVSQIEENSNTYYKGYGLRLTEINKVKAKELAENYVPEPLKVPQKEGFVVRFTESRGGYSERTYENANSPEIDFTFAFAVNWETPGERCTAKAAGVSIVQVDIPTYKEGGIFLTKTAISRVCDYMTECLPEYAFDGSGIGVNLAGNGIATLSSKGISQEAVDVFLVAVFREMSNRGLNIESLRSGGQTGVDESVQAVGHVLDVPVTIHAPKNFAFRNKDNVNSYGKEAFMERFAKKNLQSIEQKANTIMQKKSERKVVTPRF